MNYVVQRIACAIWRRFIAAPEPRESSTRNAHCALRMGFPLRPCMARAAMLAYTGKRGVHYLMRSHYIIYSGCYNSNPGASYELKTPPPVFSPP